MYLFNNSVLVGQGMPLRNFLQLNRTLSVAYIVDADGDISVVITHNTCIFDHDTLHKSYLNINNSKLRT